MSYVDGYVLPLPKKNVKAYTKMAAQGRKIWMKHGALAYTECIADDVRKHEWTNVSFPLMAKAKPNEIVVFSFIVFKNRKHRDQVNAKVMKDPFMSKPEMKDMPMPFDMKRMAYGGFKTIVDA